MPQGPNKTESTQIVRVLGNEHLVRAMCPKYVRKSTHLVHAPSPSPSPEITRIGRPLCHFSHQIRSFTGNPNHRKCWMNTPFRGHLLRQQAL